MVVDYCALDKQPVKNPHLLPYIDDLFDQLAWDSVFSSLYSTKISRDSYIRGRCT